MENLIKEHYWPVSICITFIVVVLTRIFWDLILPHIKDKQNSKRNKELLQMFNLGIFEGQERWIAKTTRDHNRKEKTFKEYQENISNGTLHRWP